VRAGGSHLQDPPAGYTGGYDDPPNFSADAVLKAKYNGLLDGVTPTRMEPFSLVTRGQACKAVARLMEKLDAGPTVTQPVRTAKKWGETGVTPKTSLTSWD